MTLGDISQVESTGSDTEKEWKSCIFFWLNDAWLSVSVLGTWEGSRLRKVSIFNFNVVLRYHTSNAL